MYVYIHFLYVYICTSFKANAFRKQRKTASNLTVSSFSKFFGEFSSTVDTFVMYEY